jgi:hypothetical protein
MTKCMETWKNKVTMQDLSCPKLVLNRLKIAQWKLSYLYIVKVLIQGKISQIISH